MLKAEVIESLLYGCVTRSPSKPDHVRLHDKSTYSVLLRYPGWRKRKSDDHTLLVRRRDCHDSLREQRDGGTETEDVCLRDSWHVWRERASAARRVMFGELVGARASIEVYLFLAKMAP